MYSNQLAAFPFTYSLQQMVSSKQLTTFSDFRRPNEPDFLSANDYVKYLRDYCTHFNLWPHINLNTRIKSVQRRCHGHTVIYETTDGKHVKWDCDAIAVCSGLHVEPNIPKIEGLQNVRQVIHSSSFKARKQFNSSKVVMVVGSGETGADISYLAVTTPNVQRVILCHRDGFHFAPKVSVLPFHCSRFPIIFNREIRDRSYYRACETQIQKNQESLSILVEQICLTRHMFTNFFGEMTVYFGSIITFISNVFYS